MVLADLRQLAGELNIPDIAGMRKGDLISAIKERQGGGAPARSRKASAADQLPLDAPADPVRKAGPAEKAGPVEKPAGAEKAPEKAEAAAEATPAEKPARRRRAASRPAGAPTTVSGGVTSTSEPVAPASTQPAANSPAPVESVPVESAPVEPAAVQPAPVESAPDRSAPVESAQATAPAETSAPTGTSTDAPAEGEGAGRRRQTRRRSGEQNGSVSAQESAEIAAAAAAATPEKLDARESGGRGNRRERNNDRAGNDRAGNERGGTERGEGNRGENNRGDSNRGNDRSDNRSDARGDNRGDRDDNRGGGNNRGDRNNDRNDRAARGNERPNDRVANDRDDSDDDGDGRGRRGRRFRDRRRGRDRDGAGGGRGQGGATNIDTEVRDDDVLLPVAGIVDILDNYAFVRTTGYLSGPNDVYVSLSMVRKYGLRRGDAITGAVRQPREGEQSRQKFNPLVRIDTLNGGDPEDGRTRPEFTKLTPLYPNERLRLETEPSKLTTRVIDLVMPVGKGQRALIVSPPKAGKTMVLQSIANAIATNNPECHLMVVLVDERPEEVTDMQRSVKGEVIASTFDRPPSDHTAVAELAIERAKRLVEMGHDVVVLLDSITRLGRAYNLAAPASGRILSGGVDSTALYPPKRFLGAARNIEDGGSLTIFATALVETGSTMDTVIFEEFKGTGNAELKLDRKIADKRTFPAVDVDASSTRKEELLMSPDEFAVSVKLRRVLAALDHQQAIDLVLGQLRKTRTNIEFLMQVAKTAPGGRPNEDD
ncbi:MAG: transcription termination factor Rho [Pseudonocardia sp.]|nr:transcription termination factor Rho [Pseudonocardia sp.]